MLLDVKEFKGRPLYFYEGIDDKDVKELREKYHLNEEMIEYVTDDQERARVEFDELAKTWLLVFNIPIAGKTEETAPASFVSTEKVGFIFLPPNCLYVIGLFENLLKNAPNDETEEQADEMTKWTLIFNVLYQISNRYFDIIEVLNKKRTTLEISMKDKMTNQNIYDLSQLSKNLVYLLTAINANVIALESYKLLEKRLPSALQFNANELEHLNDVLVEIKQAQEMAQMSSEITSKLTDGYNNIINNNLNNVMKFLTLYSIVLMIPTIVTGFFGMNVKLPFAESPFAWFMIVVFMILVSLWVWHMFKKKNFM